MVPHVKTFSRVVNKFMKKRTVENCKQDCGRKPLPDDKISDFKEHFESNPKSSLRRASIELNMSVSSVHKTLKKTSKFKAYKPTLTFSRANLMDELFQIALTLAGLPKVPI